MLFFIDNVLILGYARRSDAYTLFGIKDARFFHFVQIFQAQNHKSIKPNTEIMWKGYNPSILFNKYLSISTRIILPNKHEIIQTNTINVKSFVIF